MSGNSFTPGSGRCRDAEEQTGCETFESLVRTVATVLNLQFLRYISGIPDTREGTLENSSLGSIVGNIFQDQICS